RQVLQLEHRRAVRSVLAHAQTRIAETRRDCRGSPGDDGALFTIFAGREVAAIDRLLEERVLAVSPELADGRIGLDHHVPQLIVVVAEPLRLLALLVLEIL